MDKNHKGFTIVEVMIVLAIAGLIILAVLLAVSALQRNARNNHYKNQATRILAATEEFYNTHNRIPICVGNSFPCKNRGPDGPPKGADIKEIVDLANIEQEEIQLVMWVHPGEESFLSTSTDYLNIQAGVTCGEVGEEGGNVGVYSVKASTRSIIIAYALEGSGGKLNVQCLEA